MLIIRQIEAILTVDIFQLQPSKLVIHEGKFT